jgi:cell division protein FtsI/penicillin-binding protein 2
MSVAIVGDTPAAGDNGKEVFRSEARPGKPVRTTLDGLVQNASDAALAPEGKRAALVAVRISDGAVVGVANSRGTGAQNLGFEARVAPGSTFKMVSGLALLDSGAVDLDQPVPCPPTISVEGREFKNAWNGGLDNATFRTAFANSCNTAFVTLAPKLGQDGLARTASGLGVGQPWDLGVEVFTGSVATGGTPVDQAAAAFGQGRTSVSPIVLAAATAAVAGGHWRQPRLILDPAPAKPTPDGPTLNETALTKLRTAMREVITVGSGKALGSVAGKPVYGKTGTAEYGTDVPPRSHSWFAGWQGDYAFAVFIEDGGNEASLAVAAAKRFLAALNG